MPLRVRRLLGLSQRELGRLLGVHEMTVSRWELGRLKPSAWQTAMLEHFADAGVADPDCAWIVRAYLGKNDPVCALAALFRER